MTLPPAAILPASFHALPLLGLTSSLRFQKYRHQQDAPTGWVLAILQETLPRALCPHMGFWKPRRSYISPATTNRGHAPTRVILKEREKTHIFAASGISFLICEASTPAAITCSLIFSRSDRTLLSAGTMLKARETSCIMAAKKQSGPCGNTTRPVVDALAPAWSCSALQGFCPSILEMDGMKQSQPRQQRCFCKSPRTRACRSPCLLMSKSGKRLVHCSRACEASTHLEG